MLLKPSARLLLTAITAATLAACGANNKDSSSSSSSTPTPAPAPTPSPSPTPAPTPSPSPAPTPAPSPSTATTATLTGVVATGAPVAGAAVKVYDATGTEVASATSSATGEFSVTVPATSNAPFVLIATPADGDDPMVSTLAVKQNSVANINPLTHAIAARLSFSGDPTKLADEVKGGTATVSAATLQTRTDEIMSSIEPLLTAAGQTKVSPVTTAFKADGTGMDRVLDTVAVAVVPTSAGSNIEISVRDKRADGAQPNTVRFGHREAAAVVNTVSASNLIAEGTATLMADLATRMTTCFGLPLAQRINTGGTTAADIKADACKGLFLNNDPATYLDNSFVVSATQTFSGIYADAATGFQFKRAVYQYTKENGDIVMVMRWVDPQGNPGTNTLVTRLQDGKLKLIGDQYNYDVSITPVAQYRTFPGVTNQTYMSTGYDVLIPNVRDTTTRQPVLSKVIIRLPNGRSITMKPPTSGSFLVPEKADGTLASTGQMRFSSKWVDATVGGSPADKDVSTFFTSPQMTDSELAAISHTGNWKFEYYRAGNTTTNPDSVEYRRTRARTLTIGEMQKVVWPKMTDAVVADWLKRVDSTGALTIPTASKLTGLAWEIPTGAWRPMMLSAFGQAPSNGSRFNDMAMMPATALTMSMDCQKVVRPGFNDLHCDATDATKYAAGSTMYTITMMGNNGRGVQLQHLYALYLM